MIVSMNKKSDDDLLSRINSFDQAIKEYSANHRLISRDEAFRAFTYAYSGEMEHPVDIWSVDLVEEELITHLINYRLNHIGTVYEIEISLPNNVVFHNKVRIRTNGYRIDIHKNDADPWPSKPHGHIYEQNIKIDLSNGMCYRKRKHIYTMKKKELMQLRALCTSRGIDLPECRIK
jgi:hypothetical protein